MSVIWEDPPPRSDPTARFGRQPSPIRKEADEMLEALRSNEGQWARLWDFETKDEARKRSNYIGVKGYSFSVRQTDHGWSLYGRYNGEPETPDPTPEPQPVPTPQPEPDPSAEDPASVQREPTFQV
jgi:hypothetical protein